MKNILVVGDIYTETQFFTDKIPQENEFAFANEAVTTIGSKSINVARVLAKLGNDVSFVGRIGDDPEAEQAISQLEEFDITPLVTRQAGNKTGKIVVITPKSGKSSIILSAGANELLTREAILSLESQVLSFDGVYTSTALPLESLYVLVDICHKAQVPVFLDIPNQQAQLNLAKLGSVDFFMPNRQETALLTGESMTTLEEAKIAIRELREKVFGTIIITLDKEGCVVLEAKEEKARHFPAEVVQAKDETAAGDIFRGVFVNSWLGTGSIEKSIQKALQSATASTLIQGVSASIENMVVG